MDGIMPGVVEGPSLAAIVETPMMRGMKEGTIVR